MASAERMLTHVASWLDQSHVEYERHHFGEGDTFDPCLSLPVGDREAVEIDAVTTEPAHYLISLRRWDDSGGLSYEQVLYDETASRNAASMAHQVLLQQTSQEPDEPEQPEEDPPAGTYVRVPSEGLESTLSVERAIEMAHQATDRLEQAMPRIHQLLAIEQTAQEALVILDRYAQYGEPPDAMAARTLLRQALGDR